MRRYWYHHWFHTNASENEDWLIQDAIVLSKRLIDHLKVIQCTFNARNVIRVCSAFLFFVWKELPYDQVIRAHPCFEAEMFHILTLLSFNIFPSRVTERFAHEPAT